MLGSITTVMGAKASRTQSAEPSTPQNSTTQKTMSFSKDVLRTFATDVGKIIVVTVVAVVAFKMLPLLAALALVTAVVALPFLVPKIYGLVQAQMPKNALTKQLAEGSSKNLLIQGTQLIKDGLLTSDNTERFLSLDINPEKRKSLMAGLDVLKEKTSKGETTTRLLQKELRSKENFDLLLTHPEHAEPLAEGLRSLDSAGILTPYFREILEANAENAESLGEAFNFLEKENILTEDYISALIEAPKDIKSNVEAFKAFKTLEEAGISTGYNHEKLLDEVTIRDPEGNQEQVIFAEVFNKFPTTGLDQTLFEQISRVIEARSEQSINAVARLLRVLSEANISTEKTRQALFDNPCHTIEVAEKFNTFALKRELTTEVRFIELIASYKEILKLKAKIERALQAESLLDSE